MRTKRLRIFEARRPDGRLLMTYAWPPGQSSTLEILPPDKPLFGTYRCVVREGRHVLDRWTVRRYVASDLVVHTLRWQHGQMTHEIGGRAAFHV